MISIKLIKGPKFGDAGKAISSGLKSFGVVLKSDHIRGLTTGPRSGRLYGSHRASAPGEYPASKSGMLVSSVYVKQSGKELRFGESAKHAAYLEYGTRKMGARPHVKPSVENNVSKLAPLIDSYFRPGVFK